MKRRFTILTAALMLLLFTLPSMAWAEDVTVLSENFNNGSAPGWTLSGKTSFQGSAGAKSLQIASGSGAGSAQTPAFSTLVGTSATLTFSAVSSGSASRTLTITGNNCKVDGNASTTITATSSINTFTIAITEASSVSTITFSAASGQGTLIDDVLVYYTTGGGSTTYTVTYDGNGNTSGTVPTDDNEYESGDEVTVLGPGDLAKTGHAFSGWNTAANGSGNSYNEDDTFEITGNTTLYAQWTAYTITAQSNNDSWGSVSLSGFTITASPASGYQYATPAYTVSSGSATVVQSGNNFTVTPSSNCTVTINFEAIPTHAAIFSVNGTSTSLQVAEGAAITFPADPDDINGKTFVGWTTAAITGVSPTAPEFVTSATMGTNDVTFYAVFADVSGVQEEILTISNSDFTTALTGSYGAASITKTIDETSYTINLYACKQNSMCQLRASDSYIQIPTLPGRITNISTTECTKAGDGSYSGTIRLKSAFAAGSTPTNDIFTKELSSVNSFSIDITGNITSFYFVTSAGLRVKDLSVTYVVNTYSDYCTTVEVSTDPSVTVTPNTINAPFAGAEGTLALTYENIENFISFDYYFCDADGSELDVDPDWIQAEIQDENDTYSLYYIIGANNGEARTAYVKVYTYDDELEEVSAIVTVNQAKYVVDYATLPFEFDDGKAAIDNTNGLTQNGLGSDYSSKPKLKFDSTDDYVILKINERPGTLTFDIQGHSFSGSTFALQTSENGEDFTTLKSYTNDNFGEDLYPEEFTDLGENVRYIKWIYTNKSSGNVGLGNIALAKYVAPPASITLNSYSIEATAVETEGTLTVTYTEIETEMGADIYWFESDGVTSASEPEWMTADINSELNVEYLIEENEGAARTAYFKVYGLDEEMNEVYSNLVTISQAAYVAPFVPATYTLATSIESGKTYIISNGVDRAMGAQNDNVRSAASVTINNNIATSNSEDVFEFVICGSKNYGYTIYNSQDPEGYLYASSSSNNYIGTTMELGDDNSVWAISFNESNGVTITAKGENTKNSLRYNYNNGDDRFSCYGSNSNLSPILYLYEKNNPGIGTCTLTIDGYTDYNNKNGYCLIASPVTVDPATVEGMVVADTDPNYQYFDLYSFDQTGGNNGREWKNYKANPFNLIPGTGYLYAKKATTEGETFSFQLTGTPYSGDGIIQLTQGSTGDWADWNLVGNPFDVEAVIHSDYYIINDDGSGITPAESYIVDAMQGVFVKYSEGSDVAIFEPIYGDGITSVQGEDRLVLNLVRNRGTVIDRAIVRFGEGRQMTKFQLFENSTKLYIPQDDEDYAIVRSEAQGELPVSFRASENGTYTLSMNVENVDMNYLHLIDNMTGMDIDLLQTPSYTFEANTNDYANRFKLVFAANGTDEADESSFAFFSNGNLIVNNEGNATLQVIDINGRILSSETISGSCSKAINATTGVYMLRLINGDNVKVQKVVVR